MDTLTEWILAATLALMAIFGALSVYLHRRTHQKLDDLSRDMDAMQSQQLSRHDGTWHKVDVVREHLLNLIAAIVPVFKRQRERDEAKHRKGPPT